MPANNRLQQTSLRSAAEPERSAARNWERVLYHDPFVPHVRVDEQAITCVPDLEQALAAADAAMIVTDHSVYDWATIHRQAHVLVDTCWTDRKLPSGR